ncbi:MAG: hypothetical protein QG672_2205 [Pseudomonadota bacterium]|jgi:hypothetical protein|nr:hypothetical protein [Pseudomonadota bacterium]MDQ5941918.1 hypothetical protein [Pseudomonadota bacterium]MDQ5947282.1 hypothetical protein [Pseudomonadota bacterium]
MLARISLIFMAIVLSGCALFEPEPAPPPPPPPPKPAAKVETPKIESQPLKHLAGRNLKPMPIKPLNVKTQCTFRDEVTGTRGKLDVQVKEDEVKRFAAEVNIPKRGICRFDIKDFGQIKSQHPVTLNSRNGNACAVRMWEQGTRVTVAFSDCSVRCEGNAFEYLWPILIDGKTGRCV